MIPSFALYLAAALRVAILRLPASVVAETHLQEVCLFSGDCPLQEISLLQVQTRSALTAHSTLTWLQQIQLLMPGSIYGKPLQMVRALTDATIRHTRV